MFAAAVQLRVKILCAWGLKQAHKLDCEFGSFLASRDTSSSLWKIVSSLFSRVYQGLLASLEG